MDISWFLQALLYAAALTIISKLSQKPAPAETKTPTRSETMAHNRQLKPPWPTLSSFPSSMLLRFGKYLVVIMQSPEMAEQFLKVHDANFSSRPALAAGKYLSYNYSNLTFAPYGPYWRKTRKILTVEVMGSKTLEFFKNIRDDESRSFYSRLRSLCGRPLGWRWGQKYFL